MDTNGRFESLGTRGSRPEVAVLRAPAAYSSSVSADLATPKTNTLAILSLVFALVFWPLGIVFGHLALHQIRRTQEAGRGLALAGLVIGYVFLVFLALVLVLAIAGSHTSTSSP